MGGGQDAYEFAGALGGEAPAGTPPPPPPATSPQPQSAPKQAAPAPLSKPTGAQQTAPQTQPVRVVLQSATVGLVLLTFTFPDCSENCGRCCGEIMYTVLNQFRRPS
ncbi:unnamed protein product [Heligmosomoides polygyrus]|uniref:DUF4187 domain-containing protein n=1 Tax=Heligmosomoides polygyrus TaxID=6339 RepID=A0A183F905_HELPZ|nr:unnamed protein product [Heligmosomoides polygyrus]